MDDPPPAEVRLGREIATGRERQPFRPAVQDHQHDQEDRVPLVARRGHGQGHAGHHDRAAPGVVRIREPQHGQAGHAEDRDGDDGRRLPGHERADDGEPLAAVVPLLLQVARQEPDDLAADRQHVRHVDGGDGAGRGDDDRPPLAPQHRGPREHRRHLRRDGQPEQRAAQQRAPRAAAAPGQHEQRHRGQQDRDHVHVRAVAGLQGDRRAPRPQGGPPQVTAQPAEPGQQYERHQDRAGPRRRLHRGRAGAHRGDVVQRPEVGLRDRRIDGRYRRAVYPRAPRDQPGPRVTGKRGARPDTVRVRGAPAGGRPEERVAQVGQLRGRRHVGVRVDPGGLHPAVPHVAVHVVARLRRRRHRHDLDGDPADDDEGDRPPHRDAAQQPRRAGEQYPRGHDQRQRLQRQRVGARPDDEKFQTADHHQGRNDRGDPKLGTHGVYAAIRVRAMGGSATCGNGSLRRRAGLRPADRPALPRPPGTCCPCGPPRPRRWRGH